jgi:hypothetical protein
MSPLAPGNFIGAFFDLAPDCPSEWSPSECALFEAAFDELAGLETGDCAQYTDHWENTLHDIMEQVETQAFIANISWNPDSTVNEFKFSRKFWEDIDDYSSSQKLWSMKYVIAHEGAHIEEGPGHGESFATSEGTSCASAN